MKKILLFSLLAGIFSSGKSQDGQLDPTFGNGGITITNIGVGDSTINHDTFGSQVLLNPDGSMYFISGNLAVDYLYISKRDKNGKPDLSYGKNGYAATIPIAALHANAVLQIDGKIIIAGFSRSAGFYDKLYSVVYRLNTDGSLDNTFNKKGFKISSFITKNTETTVTIQKDGKIIVGGSAIVDNTNRYFLYRLNTNGSEDKLFSKVGKLTDSVTAYKSIAIQQDAKIVVSGSKTDMSGRDIFIISRYNTDGSIDTSFKSTGIPDAYTTANNLPPGAFFTLRSIKTLLDANGNILVAGTVKNNFGIARFKQDGSFDTLVTVNFPGFDNILSAAIIGSDGTILLSGASAIASLNHDLSLNPNFSNDGKLLIVEEGFLNGISSVTIQKDGKIVQIGHVYIGEFQYSNIAAARLNSNGTIDGSFGDMGKLHEVLLPAYTGFSSVAVQKDGKIVAGGYAFNGKDLDFAVARYTTNGSLDDSFSGDGKVMTDDGDRSTQNYIQSIAIQTDNKIIAGGFGERSTSLVRYNNNGTVEHSYGPVGNFNSIVIQKDGKFIAASPNGLSRYRNLGVDITFNGKGSLTFPTVDNFTVSGKEIALQKDEKVIVLSTSAEYPYYYPVIFRYNVNGKLDSTFGTNGIVLNYLKGSGETGKSVCVQSDDKILIGGSFQDINNNATRTFSISRINKNGSRDSTFNKGEILHVFTEGADAGNIIRLQKDGKIIIAGNSVVEGQTLFKIARFNSDGSVDKTFNNTGSVTTYPKGAYANIASIAIQDNALYAVGYASFPGTSGVIAKYRLCNALEVLPVKIIFEGRLQNNKTALNWQVQNQQNIKYFIVEKSKDSINFAGIENVLPINNSSIKAAYFTIDNSPFYGNNFYRLKLMKIDSTFIYSQLVNINFASTNLSLKISPNPAKGRLMVKTIGTNEKATIKIFDIYGRKYKDVEISVNNNAFISINIHALPKGIYSLQLIKKSTTETISFIKE